jgi:hypothetical protein
LHQDFLIFQERFMFATTVLMLTMAVQPDSFPSGPQVGDKLPDFKAHGHFGPDAGKEFKILEKTKGGPTLLIFMHAPGDAAITRPGLQFLKPVDKYASEQGKLVTQIVWVTGDKDKIEGFLKRAENSLSLKSSVSICLDGGKDGPETYGLNDKVQITVLVCKDNKVVNNFALSDPNAKDPGKVTAVAKVLGVEPPKEVQKEEKKRPAEGRPAELQKLMRQMIQKTNSEEDVKRIADEMRKWAGNDAAKQKELRAYCRQIADAMYGTEAAQAALKKLAE